MQYRYCPVCGHALTPGSRQPGHEGDHQQCEDCGTVLYRNSKPCAGALVVRDGRVLLARRAIEPALGAWDIPGGFLEYGEHPEAGAIRELHEETGLDIEIQELIGMYMDRYGEESDWILNIYYSATAGGEPQPASDVDLLHWFALDELPTEMAFHHEYEVLKDWKKRAN